MSGEIDPQAVPPRHTPAGHHAHRAGPTDYADADVRREAKKAAVWIGMAALVVAVVFMAQPLLVIFAGLVFAAMIDGGARLLGRILPIGRGWRVALVLLGTLAFLVWTAWFAGTTLADQAAQLPATVETQAMRALGWLEAHNMGVRAEDVRGVVQQALGGVGQLTRAVGGLLGGATTLFLVLVLGIYIAVEPRLYQRGIAWMLPMESRAHFHGTAALMGKSLRMLMFGRLLGMAVEGVGTWVALVLYGVPMSGLLGLLTGLLAFLPNIGAPLSGLIMVLVGFSGGTTMGLYCIAVYVIVQTVDGNIIVPMVAKKTVDLAPALVLGAQLVMGALFGILGLALADPLVAMIKVWLERHSARNASLAEAAAGEPLAVPPA
ncbi:AI-2E family transporter [Novosphingobium piscinae]|uniref:AI-2E family transporter n=1 Tax=Novosphingobium piscinae TaxID=1507448 RepID=A0A7X1FWX9_9SPHN|nr:AI-2E family transporter [Novosphingobium piscinae]MBC2668461.1 AI-2E family transporter [Novosphingobium piscinae]